ncbi:MAG: Holliday junction resolvase [Candidatus Hecatellales archaeon]|nr:MAG: Holliday junction resolvase [Candidatus Hecatellales archaeon]
MSKGVREERELVRILDRLGFAVLRAPASGSRTKLDRPDLLAGRKGFIVALEVKTTSRETLYLGEESVAQLLRFSRRFGAKPLLAVKFKHRKRGWLLVEAEGLKRTGRGFKLTLREALRRGFTPEALVTGKLENMFS